MSKHANIDAYIAALPDDLQALARDIRATILSAVPGAAQSIRYDMPAFHMGGDRYLYFAMWKAHVGVYPIYALPEELEARVAPYRAKIDTLQFKYKDAVPFDLIRDLARFKAS
ncbi:MAG: DUF1801 domain-containing protein [Deltaproteobacteria bacterium]